MNAGTEDAQYMINVRQIAKYVVGLGDKVSPTDIEEGMRVGVDRSAKYQVSCFSIFTLFSGSNLHPPLVYLLFSLPNHN